jgi:CubicO group peptidase (beta-lactamase class C family)
MTEPGIGIMSPYLLFTGTAPILLEAQQKIELDRPIDDYLPAAKLQSQMWDVSAAKSN